MPQDAARVLTQEGRAEGVSALRVSPAIAFPPWVEAPAHFSDETHRVWLRRRLSDGKTRPAVFILHNPSKAGHVEDDPTARRGIGFAIRWACTDLIFVNAATGVATDADNLADMSDPIGPLADEALRVAAAFCAAHDGYLIAAWGTPKGKARTKRLMSSRFSHIKRLGLPLHYLRLTASGYPEHPLYLPGNLTPLRWMYAGAVATNGSDAPPPPSESPLP